MKNPISLLLTLLLAVSSSSCSKPNLADIVRDHIAAVNNDDIEKNLTLFTEDSVFEITVPKFLGRYSRKDRLRNLMEWDVVNDARLTINDMKVERDTVIVKLTEKTEPFRLLGIEKLPIMTTYKFRGRLLEKAKLEFSPESARLLDIRFRSFAEWASKEHPQEFNKMVTADHSAENARLYLFLLKEWRDWTSAETASAEQELVTLEKRWNDSWVKRDPAFLDRILADDYIGTRSDGSVFSKAQEIADMTFSENVVAYIASDDFKVRVYGDAAVVAFRFTTKEQNKEGKDIGGQYRTTDTWVKRAGRWQCVASHGSEIAQK
jgi:ketosteroid isomerase-like protein